MIRIVTLVIAGATLLSAGAAAAQEACAGQLAVVRISKIKPGQAALFAKAVVDQQAWYRAHGVADNVFKVGQVLPTGAAPDGDQQLTLHLNTPATRPASDAGWDAFVKAFRDSSDVMTETRACLADPGR